jgi:hypothetical protein
VFEALQSDGAQHQKEVLEMVAKVRPNRKRRKANVGKLKVNRKIVRTCRDSKNDHQFGK